MIWNGIWKGIWNGVKAFGRWLCSSCKWLYDKTKGGILWFVGGILALLVLQIPTNPQKKKPLNPADPAFKELEKHINETVKQADQVSAAAKDAAAKADKVINDVEKRAKQRKTPILPLLPFILIIVLVGLLMAGPAMATDDLPFDLQTAYLEQVRISEEWKQRCYEADADNQLLIAEIRNLQSHIVAQNESINSLTGTIKTLQGVIEEMKTWIGKLYELISQLTKKAIGVNAGAIVKMDDKGIRIDGVLLGVNW